MKAHLFPPVRKHAKILLIVGLVFLAMWELHHLTDLRMESFDATRREATWAEGVISRGWVPPQIPESATNIHARYDLDANSVLFAFSYEPGDLGVIQASAEEVSSADILRPPRDLTWGMDWWSPPSFRKSSELQFFELPGPDVTWWIAVDDAAGRAWGWSP